MDTDVQKTLRDIPKIDEILLLLEGGVLPHGFARDLVVAACRQVVDEMRQSILAAGKAGKVPPPVMDAEGAAQAVKERLEGFRRYNLRRVVNATGVILHTNLGRAPLCDEALDCIVEVARGYSNLEFDLLRGKRGLRYDHVMEILCLISGAEDGLIVNNNAAAVLLVLNTLSEGKEAIVSRGELIEIGGEFRIPDVMEKSGAVLREVGTTNRTRLADYERAMGGETGMILKVHTSNFRIAGFTEEVDLPRLVDLGRAHGIPVMNDLGSGCFIDLAGAGLEREPTVQEVLQSGADVVTFSGDKLLGGPQAGIILGKAGAIGRIKRNPLNRALRIDKLTLAALEATMRHYLDLDDAPGRIPALRSLTETLAEVQRRAEKLLTLLQRSSPEGVSLSLKEGKATAGGGSLPTQEIPTVLLAVTIQEMSTAKAEKGLRGLDVPIITRISDDELLFDCRTIGEDEFPFIEQGLQTLLSRGRKRNARAVKKTP